MKKKDQQILLIGGAAAVAGYFLLRGGGVRSSGGYGGGFGPGGGGEPLDALGEFGTPPIDEFSGAVDPLVPVNPLLPVGDTLPPQSPAQLPVPPGANSFAGTAAETVPAAPAGPGGSYSTAQQLAARRSPIDPYKPPSGIQSDIGQRVFSFAGGGFTANRRVAASTPASRGGIEHRPDIATVVDRSITRQRRQQSAHILAPTEARSYRSSVFDSDPDQQEYLRVYAPTRSDDSRDRRDSGRSRTSATAEPQPARARSNTNANAPTRRTLPQNPYSGTAREADRRRPNIQEVIRRRTQMSRQDRYYSTDSGEFDE